MKTFTALLLFCLSLPAAEPVLRVLRSSGAISNLLQNGAFETKLNGLPANWSAYESGFEYQTNAGRNGSAAVRCPNEKSDSRKGVVQNVALNQREPAPIIVKGWSKAENVSGGADNGYALYVDLIYQDDTPLWGQTANFRCGTHDWESREVVITPEKPVKRLSVYCLFRGHSGKAWFDDVTLEEVKAGQGSFLWQGVPVVRGSASVNRGQPKLHATADGLSLQFQGDKLSALLLDKVDLRQGSENPGGQLSDIRTTGGFLARDIAAGSDVYSFEGGLCAPLNLRLATRITTNSNHLTVEGKVTDISGKDRAITLMFALPVDAIKWHWWDDIRRSRVIAGRGEYANTVAVRCGATGAMSLYPLAAINNERFGLAMAIDMGKPAIYRLVYHNGLSQFLIAYDFGLVAESRQFPSSAEFRFVIYRFDPAGGFRAAVEKLTQIFPDYFVVRSNEQGMWMPFTDISTVQGWQDFGFKYHEGNNNVPFDDANGILSFRYTEPMTWWMPMPTEAPRTPAAALKIRDELVSTGKASQKIPAQVTRTAAMLDEAGQPSLLFRNEPWCNGAVWSLNPNPALPGEANFANWHWSDAIKKRLYGPEAKGQLDGEYLDSLEGYVTADLNYNREHFQVTTVPLTFALDTKRPALFKGLAVFEFTKWICDDVHRLNKLTFANGVPYRFTFLCPWLDVMGTETDWLRGGKYSPPSDAILSLWRTMSGPKPYVLLMNTSYDDFTPDLVEKYFQRCAFYGFYPSMFSHNASENPYWKNPKWYNRDRALFKKYIPLIKKAAEAGWQPVTGATCDNPNVWLERFSRAGAGKVYLTAFNYTAQIQKTEITLRTEAPSKKPVAINELITNRAVEMSKGQWSWELNPEQTAVFEMTY